MSEKPPSVPASLNKYAPSGGLERGDPDLHDHVLGLQRTGLLRVVDELISKGTEMHPLVRWHSRGIPEADRKAFLFKQPTDSKDKRYDGAIEIAGLAGTPDVYHLGFGQPLTHKVNLFDMHHKYVDVMHVDEIISHLSDIKSW